MNEVQYGPTIFPIAPEEALWIGRRVERGGHLEDPLPSKHGVLFLGNLFGTQEGDSVQGNGIYNDATFSLPELASDIP